MHLFGSCGCCSSPVNQRMETPLATEIFSRFFKVGRLAPVLFGLGREAFSVVAGSFPLMLACQDHLFEGLLPVFGGGVPAGKY